MKFQASYFSPSGAFIRENLRRFWPIPVVGFLVYFLSGVFPILMNYKNLDNAADYIQASLANQQPFFMAAHLFLPIISAVVVFRYLQGISSSAVIHAMPLTRPALFGSNFLSSLILSASPILANGLILLILAKPAVVASVMPDAQSGGDRMEQINVFSRMAVGSWIGESFLIILFILAISIFAGIVAGNGLMHFFLALSFNFLMPLLYITLLSYFHDYLYGFTYMGFFADLGSKLSPYLYVFRHGGEFSAGAAAGYLLASVIIAGASLLLYQKRKLEKAADSLVFSFLEPVICFLITFFSMSLFGIYFAMLDGRSLYRYTGYAAGALIGFLIGQMIVKKTVRIFNLGSLKRLCVYGLMAILFLVGLNCDVTGYERRVPSESQIASVHFNASIVSRNFNDTSAYVNKESQNTFKSPQNIRLIQGLHRQFAATRNALPTLSGVQNSVVNMTYKLKNGFTLSRTYQLPTQELRWNKRLKSLYESAEYKKEPMLSSIQAGDFNFLNLNQYRYAGGREQGSASIMSKADISSVAKALVRDLRAASFEDMTFEAIPLAVLDFGYNKKARAWQEKGGGFTLGPEESSPSSVTVYLLPSYKNTLAWLSQNGYEAFARPASDTADYMVIQHITDGATPRVLPLEYGKNPMRDGNGEDLGEILRPSRDRMVISNEKKMRQWFSLCEASPINYNDYYSVALIYQNKGNYETNQYVINSDRAPTEVKSYFNQERL